MSLTEDLIGNRKRTLSLMLANIEYGHHLARALRRIHVGGYEERISKILVRGALHDKCPKATKRAEKTLEERCFKGAAYESKFVNGSYWFAAWVYRKFVFGSWSL